MSTPRKAYKGLAMEGPIANWYARNTGRDRRRFRHTAELLATRIPRGGQVLEVAPGPGYLAVELAQRGFAVTGLDISRSFLRIAAETAERAEVKLTLVHGDAAHMPLPDADFDYVVCSAAFKNFTDPVGALDEMYRVLKPGGEAAIFDMRKDATRANIAEEARNLQLTGLNAWFTRLALRSLLKNAYTRGNFEDMARRSRFGHCRIRVDGIGFEVRLQRPSES